jgi:hypothetical protein
MMRRLVILLVLGAAAMASRADDETQSKPRPAPPGGVVPPPPVLLIPKPAWSPRPARAAAVAPKLQNAAPPEGDRGDHPAQFTTEGKWDLAGYNNDEVIYTIFIESQDPRIIRCVIELSGFYYENGEKHSVKDRQGDTVFPSQRVQAGNWQGMDKDSGATYSVKCHPTT